MQRRLWREIVGIVALAANERIVFLAQDTLTDAKFDGSHRISNSRLCSAGVPQKAVHALNLPILQRIAEQRKRLFVLTDTAGAPRPGAHFPKFVIPRSTRGLTSESRGQQQINVF
jgi:hypothetical protein